jgi:hypothetical protein
VESETPLHRIAQIPDFAFTFYHCPTVNFNDPNLSFDDPDTIVEFQRHMPLIIEIKPDNVGLSKHDAFKHMIKQTLVQARHTFELEGLQRQNLHVMCIVGGYFFMYELERQWLDILPEDKDEELEGLKDALLLYIHGKVMKSELVLVQNDDGTDYSEAFKHTWNKFVENCGLGISKPRW